MVLFKILGLALFLNVFEKSIFCPTIYIYIYIYIYICDA